MLRLACKIVAADRGTTAIEYALLSALISITIIAALTVVGTTISAQFFGPIAGAL